MSKRPVELEDLLRFHVTGDTQIAPDGGAIAFTVRRVDAEKNRYRSRIWLADCATRAARPFTAEGHNDSLPRWSPDGSTLAFVSDRDDEKAQIYLLRPNGGEAEALTNLEEGGIREIAWSPDGTRIAFLYRKTPAQWTKKAAAERKEKGLSSPVRRHTKLFYRLDGAGYFDGEFPQIWIAEVHTREVHQLTTEPHHLYGLQWTPDGSRIAFLADRREDDDLGDNDVGIWTLSPEGGEIAPVPAPRGPKQDLAFSPDGRLLAYVGHLWPEEQWGGRNQRVLVVPASGAEEARDLTGHSDREIGYSTLADLHDVGGGVGLAWSPDGGCLYCPVSERGDVRLYRVSLEDGAMTPLTPADHEMGAFTLSADGTRFGILLGSGDDPHDAYLGELAQEALRLTRVSGINNDLLQSVALQMPEEFTAVGQGGYPVHGWVLPPVGREDGRRYPAIVYVHGGPAAQYGGRAAVFHEMQWLAAQGYAVFFANPRGSKGYGEEHCACIKGDWGNRDWEDVQAVADWAAARPYVDAERMAIMGGSYGGYMTAWAVGHTRRFRCAIADRLVANIHSMSGTCDFPWRHGSAWKGDAWNDPSDLWRCSPLAHAGNIETPLLLIHSDGDLRCPVSQAEEFFAALRLQRKTVEMVRFPAESSHGLSRNGPPDLRLERLRANLVWLNRWLKEEEPGPG
jgi:dipeptidyl aminopeptidase/acylaminoacyl peptidase